MIVNDVRCGRFSMTGVPLGFNLRCVNGRPRDGVAAAVVERLVVSKMPNKVTAFNGSSWAFRSSSSLPRPPFRCASRRRRRREEEFHAFGRRGDGGILKVRLAAACISSSR